MAARWNNLTFLRFRVKVSPVHLDWQYLYLLTQETEGRKSTRNQFHYGRAATSFKKTSSNLWSTEIHINFSIIFD